MPVAVIAGASGGVGAAIARRLHKAYDLVLLGRDEEKLRTLGAEVRGRWFAGDIRDEEYLHRLGEAVPACDLLVHSSGVSLRKPHEELTREDWERVFGVNVFAVAGLTSEFIQKIRRAEGDIVAINSGAGQFSSANNSVYSASKHALKAYMNSVREEERQKGVRVISMYPGYMDTEMVRSIARSSDAEPRWEGMVPVETLAEAVATAVAAPRQATMEEITLRPTVPMSVS